MDPTAPTAPGDPGESGPGNAAAGLTLDEKARLLAGADMWSTLAEPRLGIRALRFTDGPSGIRGPGFDERNTAWCTPCAVALGATWDHGLVEEIGAFVGREARRQAVDVLLAPILNLPRSPLGGRNFECFAEDPLLAGTMAAG